MTPLPRGEKYTEKMIRASCNDVCQKQRTGKKAEKKNSKKLNRKKSKGVLNNLQNPSVNAYQEKRL